MHIGERKKARAARYGVQARAAAHLLVHFWQRRLVIILRVSAVCEGVHLERLQRNSIDVVDIDTRFIGNKLISQKTPIIIHFATVLLYVCSNTRT